MKYKNKKRIFCLSIGFVCTSFLFSIALTTTSCSNENVRNNSHPNIENIYQQYANANSISLGFIFQPKYIDLFYKIASFFRDTNYLPPELEKEIFRQLILKYSEYIKGVSLLFGTGWIIDCKLPSHQTNNLATYYIATNTHVLDLSISLSIVANNNEYTFTFPVNKENVEENSFGIYFSQPQGAKEGEQVFNPSYQQMIPNYNIEWYKTNITLDNLNSSIIQFASATNDYFDFSFKYDNQLQIVKSKNDSILPSLTTPEFALDCSILKVDLDYKSIKTNSNKQLVKKSFQQMQTIFNYNLEYVSNDSNYISKLKKTIEDCQTNKIDYKYSKYFPFSTKISNNEKITVGGFPGNNNYQWTYFNTGTTNKIVKNLSIRRPTIQSWWNSKLVINKYDARNTLALEGINLLPGSSGSMVLDSSNKILGIYWGATSDGAYGLFIPFIYYNESLFNYLKNMVISNDVFNGSLLYQLFTL